MTLDTGISQSYGASCIEHLKTIMGGGDTGEGKEIILLLNDGQRYLVY